MDTFDDMVAAAEPVEIKFKNYTAGNDKSRWADVFVSFFESVGVSIRRDSNSASNIDAVENVSSKPGEFLLLMQRMFPGMFTFGEQMSQESSHGGFFNLIQEMLPIGDEERADLKRFLGKQIAEHEIQAVLSNPQQLLQLVQQSFPEYNIQLEGMSDIIKKIGRGAKGMIKPIARGVGNVTNKAVSGVDKMLTPGGVSGGVDPGALGNLMRKSSTRTMHGPVGDKSHDITDTDSEQQPEEPEEPEQVKRKFDFMPDIQHRRVHNKTKNPTMRDLESLLRTHYKLQDDHVDEILNHLKSTSKQAVNPGDKMRDDQLMIVHDKLNSMDIHEHTLHMDTFSKMIQDTGYPIVEAPEDETLPPEPALGAEVPEAPAAPTPDQSVELEPNDLDKLQVDMLELVRKALIINPKDIDSEAYMKITTAVDFNNLMELRPLLTKLVQNHYPDLEMDEVTPGPGV